MEPNDMQEESISQTVIRDDVAVVTPSQADEIPSAKETPCPTCAGAASMPAFMCMRLAGSNPVSRASRSKRSSLRLQDGLRLPGCSVNNFTD